MNSVLSLYCLKRQLSHRFNELAHFCCFPVGCVSVSGTLGDALNNRGQAEKMLVGLNRELKPMKLKGALKRYP